MLAVITPLVSVVTPTVFNEKSALELPGATVTDDTGNEVARLLVVRSTVVPLAMAGGWIVTVPLQDVPAKSADGLRLIDTT